MSKERKEEPNMICNNCNKPLEDTQASACPFCGEPVQTQEGNGFYDLVEELTGKTAPLPHHSEANDSTRLQKLEQELAQQRQECKQLRNTLATAKTLLKILLVASAVSIVLSLVSLVGMLINGGDDYVTEEELQQLIDEKIEDIEEQIDSMEESKTDDSVPPAGNTSGGNSASDVSSGNEEIEDIPPKDDVDTSVAVDDDQLND